MNTLWETNYKPAPCQSPMWVYPLYEDTYIVQVDPNNGDGGDEETAEEDQDGSDY